jgi:hypothetical protein
VRLSQRLNDGEAGRVDGLRHAEDSVRRGMAAPEVGAVLDVIQPIVLSVDHSLPRNKV